MKTNSFVIALLVGSVQSMSLRFLDFKADKMEQEDVDYLADHSAMNMNFNYL